MGNQAGALFFMALLGAAALPSTAYWSEWSNRKRAALVAWIVLWLGPPLAAIWISGVLG